MSPIDRAIQALVENIATQIQGSGGDVRADEGGWLQVCGEFQPEIVARAVIKALREPSDAMVRAALSPTVVGPPHMWRVMIDAALGEVGI